MKAVGRGWPGQEFHTRTLEEIGIPNRYSNVRNGAGLIVGMHGTREVVPVETPGSPEELPHSLPDCER